MDNFSKRLKSMSLPILPKRLEYALKVLVCLAQVRGQPIRAHEVARRFRIPTAQAPKDLYSLTWADLVRRTAEDKEAPPYICRHTGQAVYAP